MAAVDELMQHCKQIGLRRSRVMSRFYRFHRRNPALLDFLLQELVTLRQNNWPTTSFEMLWHHARWVLTYLRVPGESFSVCQNLMPHYSRLAIILFPEFNSFYRLKSAKADKDFGVHIAPIKGAEEFRRLEWADGTPIESGWRPSASYVIPSNPVPRRPPVLRTVFTQEGSEQYERRDRNDVPHSHTRKLTRKPALMQGNIGAGTF